MASVVVDRYTNRPGMPVPGAQTGGYLPEWMNFSRVPLLALYVDSHLELMREHWNKPGGTALVILPLQQIQLVVFTRYAIPVKEGPPRFVDTLEYHHGDPNSKRARMAKLGGNAIFRKAGLPDKLKISIRVFDAEVKDLKGQKTWYKRWNVTELCQRISIVENGAEVATPAVARIERYCSVIEWKEIQERFDKAWRVPML